MKILHGTWIPETPSDFIQLGTFHLWVETETVPPPKRGAKTAPNRHPFHLKEPDLPAFLSQDLQVKPGLLQSWAALTSAPFFLLPTLNGQPLPSLELSRYLETDLPDPDTLELHYWQIDCVQVKTGVKTNGYQVALVTPLIHLLNELHFLARHQVAEVQFGADLLFWYHFTQFLKQILLQDQYIPALRYREGSSPATPTKTQKRTAKSQTRSKPSGKSKSARAAKATPTFELFPGWEIISEQYEEEIARFAEQMPLACVAGFETPPDTPQFYDRVTLLRHFSECILTELVTHTPLTAGVEKDLAQTLLADCTSATAVYQPLQGATLDQYLQWQTWRDRIRQTQTAIPFHLCFQLQDPTKPEEPWHLQFLVAPRSDPSLKVALADFWSLRPTQQETLQQQFGDGFDQHLLLNLGYAARIYPKLWAGLETDQPVGIGLDFNEALEFLQNSAWVLESAGYKVMVPAWWTPQGQKRAKVKLRAKGKSLAGGEDKAKRYFSIDTLVEYQYELSIGGESVSEAEWQQLVQAKSPLVHFRGQWLHLDQDKMQQMLAFWQQQRQDHPDLSLMEFMRLATASDEDLELEFDRDQSLAQMLTQLQDKSTFKAIANPKGFSGQLRPYQKRGVSWLVYLEQLGFNGCLADDMGLGKTVQVIARLVLEQEQAQKAQAPVLPTLLVAPTSVIGNWRKEIEKFAPTLRAIVHHGPERAQATADFQAMVEQNDVVITSFTLIRKDIKLIESVNWQRVVLDEAQNIKNPKAAQTKAILKLDAPHRLALTGTPVENRLLDLWSIFNFLNPGYLGKEAQFRKSFEVPIQKNNDRHQSVTLKKLVEPFILRRLKTDQSIIKDLPDKLEQKLYCNLTKEQASLYEVVVKDIAGELESLDGIQRKGMMLATLMKLKQICNHPRQFLQDESDFTPERSHKLSRLSEMVDEVMAEGESLLIFTQFTELGDALEKYLRHTQHYNTYYIHGGTSRNKRERMIAEFQDPATEPSVFILSLKAGGVGITLTKANHVFHFDRWWNPSVEDQATDRAFRIGQQKTVFVHKFVAIGTLEERIDAMIEDKKKLAGAIVGADESWLTQLDNDAFRQLIALNKSAILE